ncbi:MAG: RluA family pseudouridine synthase [Myxococcota bacterium]
MKQAVRLEVPAALDGARLDQALATLDPEWSRAAIQRHIAGEHVRLNGALPSRGAKTLVREGDIIVHSAPPEAPLELEPEAMPLSILYEDEDLLAIDKSAGRVVHPGVGRTRGTLVAGVLHHLGAESPELPGQSDRPGVVHRLDRDTTGVIVFAKHSRAHARLAAQFAEREVEKTYLAVLLGSMPPTLAMDTPFGRHPGDRKRFSSKVDEGKRAVSHFRRHEDWREASNASIRIETGRTHQIRVHAADAGYPILGDPTYGGRRLERAVKRSSKLAFPRPALHARRLRIHHPSRGEPLLLEAPVPSDLLELSQRWGGTWPS